jgi:hypothetical protein
MKLPILIKYVLPFVQWYALMILTALGIDYALHYFDMVAVGRYLGVVGTLLIILSFLYSLRKRKMIETGSPKNYLAAHEYMAWIGSILVLVHAGIHFNALLPWLAIFMLLINVASGLVGKFLLQKSAELLKERKQELLTARLSKEEAEKQLFFDSVTVDTMRKWRVIHLPIAFLFGILSLLHIVTIILFTK